MISLSRFLETKVLNLVCVHEAGHAVVLYKVLGRIPQRITVKLDGDNPSGETKSGLTLPSNGNEATRFAAYFLAGRHAVEIAIETAVLPAETDPEYGFSKPPGLYNDSSILQKLQVYRPDIISANSLSRDALRAEWAKVLKLASILERDNELGLSELTAFFSDET